ncbi:MAG: HDOD domain-containing protein [Gammaproteobacteria bacterium]|nr:HDOD domain-containing protein [Gammaproteobacteria bacterium]
MSAQLVVSLEDVISKPLPILACSVDDLAALKTEGDDVSWARLSHILLRDPGLVAHALKLANQSNNSLRAEVTTAERAAMMMGMDNLFRLPTRIATAEKELHGEALNGYRRAVSRAYHAASQAWDWGHLRMDLHPEELFIAGLLHELGEMALWVQAPDKMKQLADLRTHNQMPVDEAEYLVLGNSIEHYSRAMMEKWHMPTLAAQSLRPENARDQRALGIMLAAKLARATERGWFNREVDETIDHVADYLGLPFDDMAARVQKTAVAVAREAGVYGVPPAAALLPLIPEPDQRESLESGSSGAYCLTPQAESFQAIVRELENGMSSMSLSDIMRKVMHGLHEGVGFNRAVFAMLSHDRRELKARFMIGSDSDPIFNRFHIFLGTPHLFTQIMKKPQGLRYGSHNQEKFGGLIPRPIRDLIGVNSFCAMSLFVSGKPVGMLYADRRSTDADIDEMSYKRFRYLCQLASKALTVASSR